MGEKINWIVETVNVSDLIENPRNPKIMNEAGKRRLQKSLQKFGLAGTIICNTDLMIIDGHSRKKELIDSGVVEVLVSIPSRKLSPEEYSEMNAIFDLSRAGDADMLLIEEILGEELMQEYELESVNKPESKEDDFEAAPPKNPITVIGDVYEVGQHRFSCGDSTDAAVVEKTLAGARPILMVTDPPYGVNYDADWRNRTGDMARSARAIGKVSNDDRIDWTLAYNLFSGDVAYVWHSGSNTVEVGKNIEDAGFKLVVQLIWNKNNIVISRGDYHWKHEPCWYAVRKGKKHNWQGSRKENSVWDIPKPQKSETGHSTQKPIECMARPIRNNTYERESVYDPFLGSGTTLIAADQLNRACYGQEIDPAYCDLIVGRFIRFRQSEGKSDQLSIKRNGVALNAAEIAKFLKQLDNE